jgi:hypothetical protein
MARDLLGERLTEDAIFFGVTYLEMDRTMATEHNIPQSAATSRPLDLQAKLYRKIGISALVAALEATKSVQNRKDSSALRNAAGRGARPRRRSSG